ncbi:phage tail protein [Hahella aquimaris]|uniref:phage tail protein n=1 Tax=Hahella sp. HNIBRBA332 TaxID=3015983 RepID=UPI00273C6DAB|nr:phage tail protein [Hahella sp. HNIBRBA332]WLQ14405.1 phage tail protein [Hahella sp. HNIBRBA332]
MALAKLRELTCFLLAQDLAPAEQWDSWMENGTLEAADKRLGAGVRVCRLKYDAVLVVERYSGPPQLLIAHVVTWLMDHDPERDRDGLGHPDIDVDVNGDDTADIEIRIGFYENLDLVADAAGAIQFGGARWRVESVPVYEPDAVGVGDDQAQPTDAPYVRKN